MSDNNVKTQDEFKKDPRIICKYGSKCYQKNPTHHEKYKHPPKSATDNDSTERPATKKMKFDFRVNKDDSKNEAAVKTTQNRDSAGNSRNSETVAANGTKTKRNDLHTDTKKDNLKVEETEKKRTSRSRSKSPMTGSRTDNRKESLSVKETEHERKSRSRSKSPKITTAVASVFGGKTDPKVFIKAKFLVDMPEDFYQFWDFCKELKRQNPAEALKDVGLTLVGPYDVLAGKFLNVNKNDEEYLRHWRYFYDPPEFQTVLKGDDRTGFHIGYFRDSPDELPVFLASNFGLKEGTFQKMGDNIFAAVYLYLEDLKTVGDPFKKMSISRFMNLVKSKAEKLKLDWSSANTEKMKKRQAKVVARTVNKLGLVVPYNRKSQQGYRELAMSDKEIKILLDKLASASVPEQKSKYLSDLQPVLTYASIAIDECDFGTGIKLGWDILCHGTDCLNSTISRFLGNSYRLLNKEAFAKIAEAHMKDRRKGPDLSIV